MDDSGSRGDSDGDRERDRDWDWDRDRDREGGAAVAQRSSSYLLRRVSRRSPPVIEVLPWCLRCRRRLRGDVLPEVATVCVRCNVTSRGSCSPVSPRASRCAVLRFMSRTASRMVAWVDRKSLSAAALPFNDLGCVDAPGIGLDMVVVRGVAAPFWGSRGCHTWCAREGEGEGEREWCWSWCGCWCGARVGGCLTLAVALDALLRAPRLPAAVSRCRDAFVFLLLCCCCCCCCCCCFLLPFFSFSFSFSFFFFSFFFSFFFFFFTPVWCGLAFTRPRTTCNPRGCDCDCDWDWDDCGRRPCPRTPPPPP